MFNKLDIISGNSKRDFALFLACSIATFTVYSILEYEFIFSGMIELDDTIFLSKAILGEARVPNKNFIPYVIIEWLGYLGSVAAYKVVWLVFFAITAGLIALVFYSVTRNELLSFSAGLFIGFIPADHSQAIFITGSHSTFALMLIMGALLTQVKSRDNRMGVFIANVALTQSLLLLAALSSPTAYLALCFLPAWYFIDHIVRKSLPGLKQLSVVLAVSILGALIPITFSQTYKNHHYRSFEGWVDFSVNHILDNLFLAGKHSLSFITSSEKVLLFFYIAIFLIILLFVFFSFMPNGAAKRKSKEVAACEKLNAIKGLALKGLLISCLSFAPASVTTQLVGRYLVIPVASFSIFLFAVLFYVLLVRGNLLRFSNILALLIFVGAGLNIIRGNEIRDRHYDRLLATYENLTTLVDREKTNWPHAAQVVILTNKSTPSPTNGLNHWSSWYLRLLAERKDLIGLIGNPNRITDHPFVDRYSDHSPSYWKVINGRSKRTRMIGLEPNRPTYVYDLDNDGAFHSIDMLVFGGLNDAITVRKGGSFNDSTRDTSSLCSKIKVTDRVFFWNAKPQPSENKTWLNHHQNDCEPPTSTP